MDKISHNVIDTLKIFYSIYGEKDEGPSNDLNLDFNLPINDSIYSDLLVLNNIIQDEKNRKHFLNCNKLLNELSNKLSIEALLIEELKCIKDKINFDVEGISNGIIWFQQAQATDPRYSKNLIVENQHEIDKIDPLIINGLKIQGSLILKLYISLVYMREGPVYEILKIGSRNKCKVINIYYKLFNSDYIRHIRNSLSHGTFKINIAGVHFIDENAFETVATQGFLDKICIWLFMIYYQCILFCEKEIK